VFSPGFTIWNQRTALFAFRFRNLIGEIHIGKAYFLKKKHLKGELPKFLYHVSLSNPALSEYKFFVSKDSGNTVVPLICIWYVNTGTYFPALSLYEDICRFCLSPYLFSLVMSSSTTFLFSYMCVSEYPHCPLLAGPFVNFCVGYCYLHSSTSKVYLKGTQA
jgi:hypothetical protein